MRYAVFSDVHANRQAWETVLADIRQQGADVLVCLGDVVGYGPMPQAVLEGIGAVTPNFVLGNHDAAVCGRLDTAFFNPDAKQVIEWTRGQLSDTALQFFNEVPLQIEEGDILFVHAEAANPGRFGYVEDEASAAESLDAITQRITFLGHTHHPIVHETQGGDVRGLPPIDFSLEDGKRYLVNVGSVGEPRTPDIRSSYVIYDAETQSVTFRKLTFDVDAYREDLAKSGLQIQPYFVQVVAYGELQAAASQQAAMVLKPNVPIVEVTRHPLLLSGYQAASPWMNAPVGQQTAVDYYRIIQKRQKRSRLVNGMIILFLLVGIGAGAVYFLIETGRSKNAIAAGRGSESGDAAPASPDAGALHPSEDDEEEPEIFEVFPLDSSLVSYWPFDGGGMDSKFGEYEARGEMKGEVFGVDGRFGDAFHFPAGSIEIDEKEVYAIGEGSFAASLWFTIPETEEGEEPDERRLISAGAGSDTTSGWAVWLEGETLSFAISNGTERKYIRVPGLVRGEGVPERWRHVAAVVERRSQTAKVFVDGKLAHAGLLTVLASEELKSASGLSIGRDSGGAQHFKGKIDDVAIWSRALQAWEVDAIHGKRRALGDLLEGAYANGR